jgi:hypothetical protein
MWSNSGLLKLYGQNFDGTPTGESAGGAGEEARLRATPVGAYEFFFRQQPRYEFSGAVFYNDTNPQGRVEQKQFEAAEEIDGSERTLTIQTTGSGVSLESMEIIPLDWKQNPLDVTQVELGESRRSIRYGENPPPEALKVRISGLNVFEVESLTACLWAQGSVGIRFHEAQAAFIRRSDAIRIDALDNPQREARGLAGHLEALLGILFKMGNGRACELDCRYQYQLTADGPEVSVPLVPAVVFDSVNNSERYTALLAQLNGWYRDASPKKGTFAFGVKLYSVGTPRPVPVLHLSQLLLPPESIADLE